LVTYPIVNKLNIAKNISVNLTVGGTLITNIAALLVLAVIVGSSTGTLNMQFWIKLVISILIFSSIILFLFPLVSRWFFKKNSDSVSQFIYVLGIVFLSSLLAMLGGIEAIIGAFLAGFALNRLIPRNSPLMNRIEFIGNAFFIPFFLIGVGMLIDYQVLFSSFDALIITIIMSLVAVFGKYASSIITQRAFKLSKSQGLLIFGLSNSQAASTLAAVLIGYEIGILDENILNGTIVMILVTCSIASFATQKSAVEIAKEDLKNAPIDNSKFSNNTLVGLANEANVECLIQLTISTLNKVAGNELFGLHIITADKETAETIQSK